MSERYFAKVYYARFVIWFANVAYCCHPTPSHSPAASQLPCAGRNVVSHRPTVQRRSARPHYDHDGAVDARQDATPSSLTSMRALRWHGSTSLTESWPPSTQDTL